MLFGGFNPSEKWTSSVGMMTFHSQYDGKVISNSMVPVTTNKPCVSPKNHGTSELGRSKTAEVQKRQIFFNVEFQCFVG
jgi:hypothetical protein